MAITRNDGRIRRMTDRELSRALVRHYDGLELFANGAAEDAVLEFQRAEAEIRELAREAWSRIRSQGGAGRDLPTVEYLRMVRRRLEEIRNDVLEEAVETLSVAADEAARTHGSFLLPFAFAAGMGAVLELGERDYRDILEYGVYGSDARRELLARLLDGDVSRVYDAMARGIRDGAPLDRMLEAVEDELLKTRRHARGAAEAVVNGAANDASMAFAAGNGMRLLYSAVMDSRVCEECAALDGTVYEHDDIGIPSLPRHVNCRCELIPLPPDYSGGADIEPFGDYASSLDDEELAERLGGGDATSGRFVPPPEGVRLSAAELASRDREIFS